MYVSNVIEKLHCKFHKETKGKKGSVKYFLYWYGIS